jgi:erythromycin esterase-like protein
MVDNFHQYQQFSKGDYFNLRDKVMADNIDWHLSKLPKNSKVIVWCATIHAAKTLSPLSIDKIPVGLHLKESLKDQMASIGFSALSGSFGRSKSKIKNIKQTPMELRALSKSTNEISYFDAKALDDLGEIEAQAIQYNSIKLANWSEILDGIIILRHEKPIELVK